MASGMTGGVGSRRGAEGYEHQGGDGEDPFSSANFSIARRVNARRSSTTAKVAPGSKRQKNFGGTDMGSSNPFAVDPTDDHQSQTLISCASKPRHPEYYHVSSPLDDSRNSDTAATRERTTANDDIRSSTGAASVNAIRATATRPRTSGQAVASAAPALPSLRFLSPLLSAEGGAKSPSPARALDGAPVGASRLQVGSTTTAAAAARASVVGGEGAAIFDPSTIIRHPRHRRRYSSLSFAENRHASTAEMIRRYRGQLGKHSISLQQPRATTAAATTTLATNVLPPWSLSDRRRWSDTSTPWHYYVSTNVAPGSGPALRPWTSVGGGRWSQDVRLLQHTPGRSRLAPATRTAGGRWGAKHGRLETLVPGEESASPSASILYRIPRESGPWVLDSNSRYHSPYS